MLSKFIKPGDKIELQRVERIKYNETEEDADARKVYLSSVCEIVSEDQLEIAMPMEKTKLLLLEVDSEYDLHFFSDNGMYQCFARVIDRYKSSNVYTVLVELTSNLRKRQGREFYRFSCALEMGTYGLSEEEQQEMPENKEVLSKRRLNKSVIVDISGGGLRFVSEQQFEEGSSVCCIYHLMVGGKNKEYNLVGKILSAKGLDNKPGFFEYRVLYLNINKNEREEIIRYIFQEERKSRKRELGK